MISVFSVPFFVFVLCLCLSLFSLCFSFNALYMLRLHAAGGKAESLNNVITF